MRTGRRGMSGSWLRSERDRLAAERILDAAERVFTDRGIAATEMRHIAAEAGCSRATLYRYFDGKHGVRAAYVHRQAQHVAHQVAEHVRDVDDPARRLTEAIRFALRRVRESPALAAWFARPDSGITAEFAGTSPVLRALCAGMFGDPADPDNQDRANWLVRIIVSLLATPGADDAEEHRMIERFAVPAALRHHRA